MKHISEIQTMVQEFVFHQINLQKFEIHFTNSNLLATTEQLHNTTSPLSNNFQKHKQTLIMNPYLHLPLLIVGPENL